MRTRGCPRRFLIIALGHPCSPGSGFRYSLPLPTGLHELKQAALSLSHLGRGKRLLGSGAFLVERDRMDQRGPGLRVKACQETAQKIPGKPAHFSVPVSQNPAY